MTPLKQRDIARRRGQFATIEQFLEGKRQQAERAVREHRVQELIERGREQEARLLAALGRLSQ